MSLQVGMSFTPATDPNTFPLSANVSFSDSNFLGTGNSLGTSVVLNPTQQTVNFNYTQNYVGSIPLSVGFNLAFSHLTTTALEQNPLFHFNGDEDKAFPAGFNSYDSYYANSYTPSTDYMMPYNAWTISLGANTAYRWALPPGTLQLQGGLTNSWTLNDYNVNLYTPFDPVLRDGPGKFWPAFNLTGAVSLDKRDIYYNPSSGYFALERVGLQGLFPFEKEHYIRSQTALEYWLTLGDIKFTESYDLKFVLGAHTEFTFLLPHPWMPFAIQNTNRLSINGVFNGFGWTGEYATYGNAMWNNWIELRIPVVPNVLSLDAFFGADEVSDKAPNIFGNDPKYGTMLDRMRFSFGGGISFALAQLPLRFLFTGNFKIENGKVVWGPGNMGKGANFVFTINLPTQ
jgi:outer membrane protein insertion porin family